MIAVDQPAERSGEVVRPERGVDREQTAARALLLQGQVELGPEGAGEGRRQAGGRQGQADLGRTASLVQAPSALAGV